MIDIVPDVIAAIRSPEGVAALRDAVRVVMSEEIRAALAEREEKLLPLGKILGCSNRAALARLTRNPELRKIGVQIGRRVLFKRSEVENYYRERAPVAATDPRSASR